MSSFDKIVEAMDDIEIPGTAWTEPGQGATVGEIADATQYLPALRPDLPRLTGKEPLMRECQRINRMDGRTNAFQRAWKRRTNLRLTGAPLTAKDLERIARAS